METKIKNFQKWYKRLDRQHRIEVREAFLAQSGMSYASWHPKVHNGNQGCLMRPGIRRFTTASSLPFK